MKLISILGPTACGKTKLAAHLALECNGEIISADSRQVYREMTIGTGKDYADYIVKGIAIPYHLIDIAEPGTEYNIFQYQRDFIKAFQKIIARNKTPILCGGSGMYLESVIKKYELIEAPVNKELRKKLQMLTDNELQLMLNSLKKLHNITDIETRERMLRAIEIEEHIRVNNLVKLEFPNYTSINFGIMIPRELVRKRISERLYARLENGMVEEVKNLIHKGISTDQLKKYGLEYKFITMYLLGEITFDTMKTMLETAIHQFSKRQMTWFRRMEKQGIKINWLDGMLETDIQIEILLKTLQKAEILDIN